MPTKVTALGETIAAVFTALDTAISYPVYLGPPSKQPGRTANKYLSVFATEAEDQSQADDAAIMNQTWSGLGQVAREETIDIKCVAGAKASTVAAALTLAVSILTDVGMALPNKPTSETYGC